MVEKGGEWARTRHCVTTAVRLERWRVRLRSVSLLTPSGDPSSWNHAAHIHGRSSRHNQPNLENLFKGTPRGVSGETLDPVKLPINVNHHTLENVKELP